MNNRQVPNLSQYPKMLFQQGYHPGIYYNMYKAEGLPWENLLINLPLFNQWGRSIADTIKTDRKLRDMSTGFSG